MSVKNSNPISKYLEILEAKEEKAGAERRLLEEKYLRRTQRILDFHERQRREAAELRRCLDYVTQHAHVLESALRGAGGGGGAGGEVPLSAALARQAAPLQRCMAQCVANAVSIRRLLAAAHQPAMDSMLAKMEAELSSWTSFLQRADEATVNSGVIIDNLHNFIAEQRRYVREVSDSSLFTSMCGEREGEGEADGDALQTPPLLPVASPSPCPCPLSPPPSAAPHRPPSGATCSTPNPKD